MTVIGLPQHLAVRIKDATRYESRSGREYVQVRFEVEGQLGWSIYDRFADIEFRIAHFVELAELIGWKRRKGQTRVKIDDIVRWINDHADGTPPVMAQVQFRGIGLGGERRSILAIQGYE